MYKRFRKSLKATSAEDSSSDESSEEEKPTVKKLNQPESSTSGNEDDDNEENIDDFFTVVTPGPDERSDPNEGYEEVGIVTEGDLDDGKDEEGIEYRCSLCPRKVLRSLDDVRKHLAGKEHLARERKMKKLIQLAQNNPEILDETEASKPSKKRKRDDTQESSSDKVDKPESAATSSKPKHKRPKK